MGRLLAVGLALLAALGGGRDRAAAQEPPRLALLIGNQGYADKVGKLKNPHADIAIVGDALRNLGFKVTLIKDGAYKAIDIAIKRHIQDTRLAGNGALSFVYYSGHGAADPVTRTNYLIPVDVPNADDDDLWTNSLNLNYIVETLRGQAPAATHYVVFDACRNELNLMRRGTKALTDKGFVPIAYTPGVMVAYATAPGKTAADTGSGGGPYAQALAQEIVKPGVEALTMFRRVALRVHREIGQDPWMSASTLPEVYFARQATPTPAQHEPSRAEIAQFCQSLATNPSVAVVQSILDTYKGTPIAACAQARLDELKRGKIASPEPQRPAPPAATAPPPPRPSAPPSSGNAWMDALRTWLDGSGPALPPYRDAKPNPITSAPLELKVQSSFARTLDVLGTLVHSLSSEVESV